MTHRCFFTLWRALCLYSGIKEEDESVMKFGWIIDRKGAEHNFMRSLIEACRKRNIDSDLLCPCAYHSDPSDGVSWINNNGTHCEPRNYDVVILRSRSVLGQAFISYAERAKVLAFNSYLSTKLVSNKAEMFMKLNEIGISCISTTVVDDSTFLPGAHFLQFPLSSKTFLDEDGQGFCFVRHPIDLESTHWGKTPTIIQNYVKGKSRFLKLYVCGDKIFAIHIPYLPYLESHNHVDQPRMVSLDNSMFQLAQRCCEAFNLTFFSIDVIETAERMMVIDIDCYPHFVGIPHAADLLIECALVNIYRHREQMRVPSASRHKYARSHSSVTEHSSTKLLPVTPKFDLSGRELDIARLLIVGQRNQQIGDALHITERTVRYHLQSIYSKLGVQRRSEAIACLVGAGLRAQSPTALF